MIDRGPTLEVLRDGEIEIVGRIVGSSNNAMLVTMTLPCPDPEPAITLHAIYKPTQGERPLADFPDGTLANREVAAWHVSEASGWAIVPPTVLRDGPFGEGIVQAYVEMDSDVDVVAMVVEDDPRLRRMAVLDAVMNNTDRKGGDSAGRGRPAHLRRRPWGDLLARPQLRTVLWGWRGRPFDDAELEGVERFGQRSTPSWARRSGHCCRRPRFGRRPAGPTPCWIRPVPLSLAGLAGRSMAAVLRGAVRRPSVNVRRDRRPP